MSPRKGLDPQKVLQTAAQLADAQGVQQVSIATLAKALGVRSPSLYNHVAGLADLRKQLALYGLDKWEHALMRSVVGKSGDTAVQALCMAYLAFVRKHPGLYEATLFFPATEDADIDQASNQVLQVIVDVLQAYPFSETQLTHAIRGLRSLVHGFASIEQRQGFQLDVSIDESFEFLVSIYINGLHSSFDSA